MRCVTDLVTLCKALFSYSRETLLRTSIVLFAMAVSGVKCVSDVKQEFEKLGSKHLYRYITFKISEDGKHIVVDKIGGADKTFDDLKNDLPRDDCRYAVFDLKYETKEQQRREKVIFITLVPDDLPKDKGKLKMLYSSSKKALLDNLGSASVSHCFQFGDFVDLDFEEITDVMRTRYK